jgi:4-aminobutyrate aminotransferase
MQNAARLGPILLNRLNEVAARHPQLGKPRGIGLMCGVDVLNDARIAGDPQRRQRIVNAAFRRGAILLPCGTHTVRFCPPLCVTDAELDLGVRLFEQAVVDAA